MIEYWMRKATRKAKFQQVCMYHVCVRISEATDSIIHLLSYVKCRTKDIPCIMSVAKSTILWVAFTGDYYLLFRPIKMRNQSSASPEKR